LTGNCTRIEERPAAGFDLVDARSGDKLRHKILRIPPALTKLAPAHRRTASFTVVEVMMATLILMVGFIGLIEAVTVASNAMDHARRQSLAAQILAHYTEELYLASWSTISNLSTSTTSLTIDSQFNAARQALGDDLTTGAVVRFTLSRYATNPDPLTNFREINFTVTWVVKTSRRDSSGNRVSFTFSRSTTAWYGKYGLPLSFRQS
jgi:Tfp pilus assembly protein PilV